MAYIGKSPSGTGVRIRYYFTQTSGGATSISGTDDNNKTLSFSDGEYVDVYLNGVSLVAGTDYDTTTANTIGGLSALANGDVIEVVVYDIFTVADTVSQSSGGTFNGAVIMSNGLTVDDDGATVLTLDRATSDGTVIDIQKDGTSVGNIGAKGGDLIIGTGDVGIRFHDANDVLRPTDQSTGSGRDNAIDIGDSGNRFKDLYLSGGAYLGGTAAGNHLDDYEEGTWTATLTGSASAPSTAVTTTGNYRKIGEFVFVECRFASVDTTGASGTCYVTGFPYTSVATFAGGDVMSQYTLNVNATAANIAPFFANSTTLQFQQTRQSISTWVAASITAGTGRYLYLSMTYPTSS